jgi:hypothetical protein
VHGTPCETMLELGPGQHFSLQDVQSWIGTYYNHLLSIILFSFYSVLCLVFIDLVITWTKYTGNFVNGLYR